MARTLVLILALFSLPARAMKEYYSLGRTPRAMALGGAFYGLSDDEGALFYNPAGLAAYEGGTQILPLTIDAAVSSTLPSAASTLKNAFSSSDTATIVSRLTGLQGKLISGGGGAFPFLLTRGFALGVLVGGVKGNLALTGKEIDGQLDVTAFSDNGIFLGKAFSFGKSPLRLGVTLKALWRAGGRKVLTLVDFANQTPVKASDLGGVGGGIDADIGLMWLPKRGNGFALTFTNLLATAFPWARSATHAPPPGLPRMVSLGGFFTTGDFQWRVDLAEFGLGGQRDPDLGARTGSFFKHVNLGVEWPLGKTFSLRAGLHQGSPSGGFGLNLPVLRLDFATWGEELGLNPGTLSSRRFGLRLAFGYVGSGASKK